jgi:hypothetical protein
VEEKMSIEAMKQALEALEMYLKLDTMDEAHILEVEIAPKAITALRTAIAEAEKQEPVCEVLNERGEVDYISYVPPVGTMLYAAVQNRGEQK